jgi:hypothetical protein
VRRSSTPGARWWVGAAVEVLRRPALWAPAASQIVALAPRRWWRQRPYLPVPAERWLAFRMETAYGDERARPAPADVVAFLEWARETRSRPSRLH